MTGARWWCLALGIAAAAERVESAGLRRRQEDVNVAASAARRWLGHLEAVAKAARENGGAGPFWKAALTTPENPELVAEDEDLEVLGVVVPVTPAGAHEEGNEGADDQVDERPHRWLVPV